MRKYLFRGKLKMNNEWRYSQCPYGTLHSGVVKYDFIPETVGQFTGMYDSTNWEDLTDTEKLDFYRQHYIGSDGMSVRFQHIDDVKILWKGKKIYEGDIVRYTERRFGGEDVPVAHVVKFEEGGFAVHNYFLNHWLRNWADGSTQLEGIEVIGNIHDNPELLEGGVE